MGMAERLRVGELKKQAKRVLHPAKGEAVGLQPMPAAVTTGELTSF